MTRSTRSSSSGPARSSAAELLQRCLDKQVPVGKLNSIADIFEDEHYLARGNLVEIEEPDIGKVVVPGVVPTLSETPGRITHLGGKLGEATDTVLRELLGLTAEEIADLHARKIA